MDKPPLQVLLVEDSPTDIRLLRQIFLHSDREKWELVYAERLSEAIDACCQQAFDVVLLDLYLPDSDGLDTVVEFRIAIPDVPVIVLTMMDDEEMALKAMASGAQDYLVKDQITIQLLVRSIRYAIERGQILKQLKNGEQTMLRALEQEQELNLLKSNFISMASHELRTPMTLIRTSVELLQRFNDELAEDRRNEYFERIKIAIQQITHLLDEVLLLGSTEAGGLRYKPEPLALAEFCCELAESLQFSNSNQHTITFTHQGDCSEAEMDATLLRYILTNLLSNAIKYSPEGGIIRFNLACEADTATFHIQDQGIGIPLKDQMHLFETFYRCSNVGKIPGTGLGLVIARKCVDLHRGQIQVSSEVNNGTTFTVMLPLKYGGE